MWDLFTAPSITLVMFYLCLSLSLYSVWNSPCTWPSTPAPDRTACTGASWAAGNPKTTQVHRGRKHRLNRCEGQDIEQQSFVSFNEISVSLFSSILFRSFCSFNNLTLTAGISYSHVSYPHWVVLARRGKDELVVWMPVEAVDLWQVSSHVLGRCVRLLLRDNQEEEERSYNQI